VLLVLLPSLDREKEKSIRTLTSARTDAFIAVNSRTAAHATIKPASFSAASYRVDRLRTSAKSAMTIDDAFLFSQDIFKILFQSTCQKII
jgi:hypothetical protein